MKSTLLLALIISACSVNATTYYFSTSGNDANNGTSASTPWRTLTKFNSVFASKSPGDNFLFKRGDVFYGSMNISRSGTSTARITIGAYGTGANPVISGLTTVGAWTKVASYIWESTTSISSLPAVNMVVIKGVNTPMGRYPNTGYLTYQTYSGRTSITSSSLSGTPNWKGAEVVIRKQRWIIDRNPITAHSGGTLTYTASSTYNGQSNYGFFIQNDSRTLDRQNEWYYSPSTKKLRVYSTTTPTNVQVATKDTLVYMKYRAYITFDNVSFQGSNKNAFVILSSNNITIQNCFINYSGGNAIWGNHNFGKPSSAFVLKNTTINNTNNVAIRLASEFAGALISNNTIKNTGMIVGMGGSGDGTYEAVSTRANNVVIEYNKIDTVGYTAIRFLNNYTIIRNNVINGFCFVKLDGAGIYTWIGVGNTPATGQKVLNNIVLNGMGSNAGTNATGNPISHGIYIDDWSANVEISGNTTANCSFSGLYIHNARDLIIRNNTSFNNGTYQALFVSTDANSPIRRATSKNNVYVARTTTQQAASYRSRIADLGSFGAIDSNYYARPVSDNVTIYAIPNNTTTFLKQTLAQWQTYSKLDTRSKKSPKAVTTVTDVKLVYNASSSSRTFTLDAIYVDVKNVSYNKSITLGPWKSAVLIKSSTSSSAMLDTLSSTQFGVKVYPNPLGSTAKIVVAGTDAGAYNLVLVDASGKIVWRKSGSKPAGDFQELLNSSTLKSGFYFLKVTNNNNSSIIKLIK